MLFNSKGFTNINELSWAVEQVFKPYSIFTDKEMKALAQVQSFQKQKLLLRALLDTQHQTSERIDFPVIINVNYMLFTSAKLGLNMYTQKHLLKIQALEAFWVLPRYVRRNWFMREIDRQNHFFLLHHDKNGNKDFAGLRHLEKEQSKTKV